MIEKVINNVLKIVLIIFSIALMWIVTTGIVSYEKIIYTFNPIILFMGIIICFALMILVYKKIIPKLEKIKNIEYILIILFTILSILSGLNMKISSEAGDMGIIFKFITENINSGNLQDGWYLNMFPNNIMFAAIQSIILIFTRAIGINSDLNVITIVTSLMVSVSVYVGFLVMRKIYNRKNALMFLIICLLSTPLYMYSALYYTDSFSMPISMLLFYLWIVIEENKKIKVKIPLNILYGILLFIGYELKLTSIFVFIAIMIYELSVGKVKETLRKMLIIIPVMMICIFLFDKFVVTRFTTKDLRDKHEIPKMHWIMMGMNGNGNFSMADYEYTKSFESFEEKKQAVKEKLIERITQGNIITHIKNLGLKLKFAWHDGTYYAPNKMMSLLMEKNIVNEFLFKAGDYNKIFKYIPQSMHFTMLVFIVINNFKIIKNREYKNKNIICIITIVGVMTFLIIWENRSRYLVNNLLLMIMIEVYGIEHISNQRRVNIALLRKGKNNEENINNNTNV